MLQKDYITKKRKFQHPTKKRAQIEILPEQNMPNTQISKETEIARSILYRKLERDTVTQLNTQPQEYKTYLYEVGQRIYEFLYKFYYIPSAKYFI